MTQSICKLLNEEYNKIFEDQEKWSNENILQQQIWEHTTQSNSILLNKVYQKIINTSIKRS